jgi:hypothetical protein
MVGHYEGDTFVVDKIGTTAPSRHLGKAPTPAATARFAGLTAIVVIADK